MPKTIVLNSSHFVQGSGNKYLYPFPTTCHFEAGSQIAVANISIYNSLQNITAQRGNNSLVFNFLGTNYTFLIPDGYYSIADLNYYLQNQCILNGLYCTANSGSSNVYFIELAINSVRYATSLNFYTIPTSSQAIALGYSQPANATWSYPASAQTPTLTFNQIWGNLVGQTFGTYPAVRAANIQLLSTQTPVISPSDSLIFCCNLVSSKYSIPSNVFYTVPISASVGSMILFNNASLVYNSIIPQNFSNLEITIYDQNFLPVNLLDREMTLTLSIIDGQELLLK